MVKSMVLKELHTLEETTMDKVRFLMSDTGAQITEAWFWLRDVVSSTCFANVSNNGSANYYNASRENGVRPAFPIG